MTLTTLAAATAPHRGFPWGSYVVLLLLAAAFLLFFRWLRPRLHRQRQRSWAKAGLLPEQVDPEGHAHERQRLAQEEEEERRRAAEQAAWPRTDEQSRRSPQDGP